MRFLIDTFSPEAAKHILDYYPADGVTTNPAIICREKKPLKPTLMELREAVGVKMLHVQTMQTEADAMLDEALSLRDALSGCRFFVKLPCNPEGIKACRAIKSKGVGVTVTAVFSPMQALVAARAGADFVAPYVNKLEDVGEGLRCVKEIKELFDIHALPTQILSASFRNVRQVTEVALFGSHYATLPPAFFDKLVYHPMTENAVKGFEDDWQELYGDKRPIDLIK